jgi:hypothetical protein
MNATEPREKLLNHSCQAVLLRGIVGLLMVNAGAEWLFIWDPRQKE